MIGNETAEKSDVKRTELEQAEVGNRATSGGELLEDPRTFETVEILGNGWVRCEYEYDQTAFYPPEMVVYIEA